MKVLRERTKGEIREVALKLLSAKGFEVWRNNNMPMRGRTFIGRKGVSDIIGVDQDCLWVVCEVKTITDRFYPEQIQFLLMVQKRGGHAYVALQDASGNIVIEEFDQEKHGKCVRNVR